MTTEARHRPVMRNHHQTMLAVAIGVVLLSFMLQVRGDQRVELRWLPGVPMPQTCFTQELFGLDCPGCGLTRSFIYLSRNDWQSSWSLHRLGWLMAIAVLLQFPYRIVALRRGELPLGRTIPRLFGRTLVVLLIANWIIGFFV